MPLDQRFAEACIQAQARLSLASYRLKAANQELNDAEREHRLATEVLEQAEKLYYARPDYGSTSKSTQENK
jgi:hypothetical protein